MKKIIIVVILVTIQSVPTAHALETGKATSDCSYVQKSCNEENYFPTEAEWNTIMSDALAAGEITEDEVITYAELEVCEFRWQGRRESSNVEDRRRWGAREWLWWATNIGQY